MIISLVEDPGSAPEAGSPGADVLSAIDPRSASTVRRIGDLCAGLDDGTVHLDDPAAARAAVRAGQDRELYRAHRDVLPPRAKSAPSADRSRAWWYADLVRYSGGTLSGTGEGELCRSVGHWNTARQLEIFECWSGRVLMLYTNTDELGLPTLDVQWCRPGELVAIPFRQWHLTVAVDDAPAVVFNVYTDLRAGLRPDLDDSAHDSRAAAQQPGLKYRGAPAPRVGVVRTAHGIALAGDPAELAARRIRPVDASPAWLAGVAADGVLVAYRTADPGILRRLEERACVAAPTRDALSFGRSAPLAAHSSEGTFH